MCQRRLEKVATLLFVLFAVALPAHSQEGRIDVEGAIAPPRIAPVQVATAIGDHNQTAPYIAIAPATTRDGIFVADRGREIYLYEARPPLDARRIIDDPELLASFENWSRGAFDPRGLAISDDQFYFFDGATRRIWSLDLWDADGEKPQPFSAVLNNPTHMAVSSQGVAAVADSGELLLLQEDEKAVVYDGSKFPDPVGVMFSAWNTLHVLDQTLNAIVTITFNRTKDGRIRFLSERRSAIRPSETSKWQAMTAYEGVVYLADRERVYAYIESESKLVPVVSGWSRYYDIKDIAVSESGLYVLDGYVLEFVPRAEPVDLVLDGDIVSSQNALTSLYKYLLRQDMLPTREVRARKPYDTVQQFLFEHGALIAPPEYAEPDVRFVYNKKKSANQFQEYRVTATDLRSQRINRSAYHESETDLLICTLNKNQCGRSSVPQDARLIIPDFKIERRLGRRQIKLSRPLEFYIEDLVFSKQYLEAISPAFIKRINPELRAVDESEIYSVSRGTVVVPVEQWLVTMAVPTLDFEDRRSELWAIAASHEGVALRSRQAFATQAAHSMLDHHTGGGGGAAVDSCGTLRGKHETWFKAIKYPHDSSGGLIWPDIATKQVRVGVLEMKTTLLDTHQLFGLSADRPTWHSFNILSELEPNPDPQSFESGAQAVHDAEVYSTDSNHGTHVAGLIAGRKGPCWSGLLPSARLVLIDLTDQSKVPLEIKKAVEEDVRVFNISYAWPGPKEALRGAINKYGDALWVVAAGNDGDDLDEMDEGAVPVPARWGKLPNVITVTASGWDGLILEQVEVDGGTFPGVNRGRKYVDLVAPGENVYSASEQKKYGPATGTSQATPQVAAAAAILVDRLGERLTPGDAKARLIATADWLPSYKDKVWGGRLNFGAAVMYPDRSYLQTKTSAGLGEFYLIEPDNYPKIQITNLTQYYERDSASGESPRERIKFSDILSLQKNKKEDDTYGDTYRVVLREQGTNKLKILLDAKLAESTGVFGRKRIFCQSFEKYNVRTRSFEEDTGCDQGLSITQIVNYVQGGQYQIDWSSE